MSRRLGLLDSLKGGKKRNKSIESKDGGRSHRQQAPLLTQENRQSGRSSSLMNDSFLENTYQLDMNGTITAIKEEDARGSMLNTFKDKASHLNLTMQDQQNYRTMTLDNDNRSLNN